MTEVAIALFSILIIVSLAYIGTKLDDILNELKKKQ
jgi:hypothetical protein